MAGINTYEDYVMAIKKSRKFGSTVLLKRDVDETRIRMNLPSHSSEMMRNPFSDKLANLM